MKSNKVNILKRSISYNDTTIKNKKTKLQLREGPTHTSIIKEFTSCDISSEESKENSSSNSSACINAEKDKTESDSNVIVVKHLSANPIVLADNNENLPDNPIVSDSNANAVENLSANPIVISNVANLSNEGLSLVNESDASLNDTPTYFDGFESNNNQSKNGRGLVRTQSTPTFQSTELVSPLQFHKKETDTLKRDISYFNIEDIATTDDVVKSNAISAISRDELAAIIDNDYVCDDEKCHVIDCRYPFEYVAGHIDGAINIYTPFQLLNFLFVYNPVKCKKWNPTNAEEYNDIAKKNLKNIYKFKDFWWKNDAFVFHCEFSSKRGPKLATLLRDIDRHINFNKYPKLSIPKLFILENGYQGFYGAHQNLCQPRYYKKMELDDSFSMEERIEANEQIATYTRLVDQQANYVREFLQAEEIKQRETPS